MIRLFFFLFCLLLFSGGCQRRESKYSEDYVLIEFAAKLEEENARYHYDHQDPQ